ncbi:bifunctional hydroxymethylpyrimidine kinase/phosphomethylpyrimidine kinase [Plantactinospora sp. S1510]|uniref:Bifunctional hydroxymethylpyrimidine kinase/phosphomethylpyrimidine kinase n=1 Tax=Plantactinospora alkalitolerans TaxID=2789879 RepID=A0ABS0GZH8_9ACTN|nr:bifunctional hydroxymethylpyrimidine kinase/phosphomethylpyrimidine kinase [Plantactinospora alkalitolerans]MBF9131489.1 bifunctional hydroxymethylpyrimidine kinase/phosphomethylpyrimidine kinase [Plantactinospora alkalitolerans]
MTPPIVLTVAGSDSGAGAGVQADLKVFAAMRLYGTSVITAITAQNTRDVRAVFPVPAQTVTDQLTALADDLPPLAVKTGMLGSTAVADAVSGAARSGMLPNLVVDPVLVSTSGRRLGVVNAIERLLPYAMVMTPNRAEASAILGWVVSTPDDMAKAARQLAATGSRYVVVTGGDADAESPAEGAVDALWTGATVRLLRGPWVETRNTHGTGCSFSAAIAGRLALGDAVPEAVVFAKRYVARALLGAQRWELGGGHGPLDHHGWSGRDGSGSE